MARLLPVVGHSDYVAPLPSGHSFPMAKFARLLAMLTDEGLVTPDRLMRPGLVSRRVLGLVHEADYVEAVLSQTLDAKAQRRIGVPITAAMAMRSRRAVAGTILTARAALKTGIACNTAGGSHHAFPGHGAGYCIFNDVAVAARLMQREGLARRVLVVDLDVHQGDGTAAALQGDRSIFTFSIHCGVNFPPRKQASDLDVALEPETGDAAYLAALETHLPPLFDEVRPDLVIYVAGVDTHGDDRLGKLALTDRGLENRERFVLAACAARRVPVATVLGGGYSDDVDLLARRHGLVFRAAADMLAAGDFDWGGR
jgi:acetoin utilization deacetylase AcuC-like enzyme